MSAGHDATGRSGGSGGTGPRAASAQHPRRCPCRRSGERHRGRGLDEMPGSGSAGSAGRRPDPLFSPVSADPVVAAPCASSATPGDYTVEFPGRACPRRHGRRRRRGVILPEWRRPCTCWSLVVIGGVDMVPAALGGLCVSGRVGRSPGRARLDARRAG